jgi:hypothetical protein
MMAMVVAMVVVVQQYSDMAVGNGQGARSTMERVHSSLEEVLRWCVLAASGRRSSTRAPEIRRIASDATLRARERGARVQ